MAGLSIGLSMALHGARLSGGLGRFWGMNTIAFVPGSRELLVRPCVEGEVAPGLLLRLQGCGWPVSAQVYGADGEGAQGQGQGMTVRGQLVELIDALPLLAAMDPEEAEEPLDLQLWRQVARLALLVVERGLVSPRLRRRGSRWEARWRAVLVDPVLRAEVARLRGLLVPQVAVLAAGLGSGGSGATATGRLVYQVLDACVDTLVREASRRGALVRLGQWASGSWEQQLVRALGDDRASVYFDGCGDGPQVEAMAAELNAWAEQWEQDQAGQVGRSLSLLASPVMWQAPESLAQVLRRLLHPAAQLAAGLAAGRPAPRMLPVSSWQPASTSARGRVARMAGVAGRQLATRAA